MVVTFTIPDEKIQLIINSICTVENYQEILVDGTKNPESKMAFAKRMWGRYPINCIKSVKGNQAADEARMKASLEADAVEIT
jgi:hypothetical protein